MDMCTKLFLINIVAFCSTLIAISSLCNKEKVKKAENLNAVIGLWGLVVFASIPSWIIYIISTS